ncbi:hypothetical protein ID47_10470 [Candidatus Paracaedibacter acanthamoebae]|uniref:DUF4296 domain-containing protein n=2 Tax=Candidatus Odyssella acanthamoebae TaxID=91604 RepID=A0A077AYJ7_9PROT|nr:hypothetical protein ID47_10470 [Candidatus Paracaedibacter acanthamoebae]
MRILLLFLLIISNCFSQDSYASLKFDFFYLVKIIPEPEDKREYISPYAYPSLVLEKELYNLSQKDNCTTEDLQNAVWGANYIEYYKLEAAFLYRLMQRSEMCNLENLSKFRATMLHLQRQDIYDYTTTLINRVKDLNVEPTLQIDVLK